jgi:hypothetical protein
VQKILSSARVEVILQSAISSQSIVQVGSYTEPRTWGVYQLKPSPKNVTKKIFRIGNHPVRKNELERDFGAVELIALFSSRYLADELATILNE